MRSIAGVLVLLVVVAVVGFLALRQTLAVAPAGAAASGGLPSGPAARAGAAQQRAVEDVARAMQAASASRDAAETR